MIVIVAGTLLLVSLIGLVRALWEDGIDRPRNPVHDWSDGTTLEVARSVPAGIAR